MKTAAKGTRLTIGGKTVGSLKSIGGLSLSADTIDVTTIDNENGYKEFLGGLKDGGEVPVSGFFDYSDEGQKAVYAAFESGEVQECAIVFPEKLGCQWSFSGVVTALETGAELEDAVTFDATVKVSGKPKLEDVPEAQQVSEQPAGEA